MSVPTKLYVLQLQGRLSEALNEFEAIWREGIDLQDTLENSPT